MKNGWIKTAGVFLLAALMVTGMDAQPRRDCQWNTPGPRQGYRQGPGRGYHQQPAKNRQAIPDLTEEQQDAIKELRLENHKVMKPLKNKMIELKARERTLLSEEKVDLNSVNSVIDEQTDLTNKMRKLQVEQRLKMKEILTDEQIMKLEQRKNFARQRRARIHRHNG